MTNVEKLIKQALSTFSKPQPYSTFQENLGSLVQSAQKLTLSDVFLDKSIVVTEVQNRKGPVVYVPVFEDRNILVSMFILKPNSEIPLHDHPLMYGIIKVLSGSVLIQSYSPYGIKKGDNYKPCLPKDYFYVEDLPSWSEGVKAKKSEPVIVSELDDCGLLTPAHNNFHAIRCHEGPAVFFDILSPPYDVPAKSIGKRICSYFEETSCVNGDCVLSTTKQPPENYWTSEMPFKGPKIRVPEF